MRVLITGATGFIGQKLGLELVRLGHEVVALTRNSARTSLPFPAELHDWRKPQGLKDIDAVVHLAGESIGGRRWSEAQKKKILSSRVETAENLLEILKSAGGRKPQVFISASAIGFYGDRGDELLSEAAPRGQGFLADICVAWEEAAEKFRPLVPRVVELRTGIVLGRGGGALEEILPLFKRGVGGRLGSGRQWMSWIHVDDMVQVYLRALSDSSFNGPVNAVAPNPVTNAEFTQVLASTLKTSVFLPAPAFVLKIALGEMSALLLESQRVQEGLTARGFQFQYTRLSEALLSICRDVERARGVRCHAHRNQQWLPLPLEQVFPFFAEVKNLEKISPPENQIKVLAESTSRGKEGSWFEYSLRARGLKFLCRTNILDWIDNQRFSSTQTRGPFTLWFHTHNFERLGGGTLITDRVIYRLKFGYLGDLLGATLVKKDLARIFSYRQKALNASLNAAPLTAATPATAVALGAS